MRVGFTKMHGAGNDFVVFDAPPGASLLEPAALRALADRRTGIGFDQALVLQPPHHPGTAVFYRIFNADGGEVEQCGNGARCIAALLHRRGFADNGELTLDSPSGHIRARVGAWTGSAGTADTRARVFVSVEMGVPNFDPAALPFEGADEADSYALEVAGRTLELGVVSIGNPHAVLTVASADSAPVESLGPAIENHPRFPQRANVGFLEIVTRREVRLRVYERGTGETASCGTGACAAVAVGRRRGQLDSEVRVLVRGGELRVNWTGPGESIWLTGPAEVSFEGHVEV